MLGHLLSTKALREPRSLEKQAKLEILDRQDELSQWVMYDVRVEG
jgi:hypothetical protein